MIHFIILFSRQGKIRLQKWYEARTDQDKKKTTRELTQVILARKPKMCNFLEWRNLQIVYKRYASLFFAFAIDRTDNELITLEIIHRYVEVCFKLLKFIYSEKATKFCEIFILLLSCVVPVKSKVKILQNCVAFPEYLNVMRETNLGSSDKHKHLSK